MSRLFAYRATGRTPRPDSEWLVVFSPDNKIPLADLFDLLSEDIGTNLQPDGLLFIVRDDVAASIAQTLRGLPQQDWRVPIGTTGISVASFSVDGSLGGVHWVCGPRIEIDRPCFEALRNRGLREIFHRRDGLVRPSETTHFVHPSGKHSKAFIRTANLLVLGPEVMFIAMAVLKHLVSDLAYVCVDTSSIASIGHAAIELRRVFDPAFQPPTVNSFSSWAGINGTYSFPQPGRTLALVSATTSGNMARALVEERGLSPERTVILFALVANPTGLNVLCNLAEDPRYEGTLELVTQEFREGDCPLCRQGSTPVHFVGDQFLAEAIRHVPVKIFGHDIPDKSKAFFGRYRCKGAIGMRQVGNNATAVDTYHIDVGKLDGPVFEQRLKAACERHVAASTTLIVHPGDKDSTALAARIATSFAPSGTPAPMSASSIGELDADSVSGAVLVVAGCIGSGGSLQSISRDLRDPAGDTPRTYLVGVAKHPHHPRHASLRSDLMFSSTNYRHVLVVLEELTLPERRGPSAWEAELGILNELIEPKVGEAVPAEVRSDLADRIDAINGLADSVASFFWPAPSGESLALRKTFAFWDGEYAAAEASQGDILATVACVLENLRDGPSPRLHRTAFHHGFIAPSTFGRFNDGVIQASFLRAAMVGELDYSGDEDASREMSHLLYRIFHEWRSPRGEAATEFLISIMSGRMKLKRPDLETCLKALDGASSLLVALRAHCLALAVD